MNKWMIEWKGKRNTVNTINHFNEFNIILLACLTDKTIKICVCETLRVIYSSNFDRGGAQTKRRIKCFLAKSISECIKYCHRRREHRQIAS